MDPSNPQTLNRYAYVANGPMNFTDPLGLQFGDPQPAPDPSCGLVCGIITLGFAAAADEIASLFYHPRFTGSLTPRPDASTVTNVNGTYTTSISTAINGGPSGYVSPLLFAPIISLDLSSNFGFSALGSNSIDPFRNQAAGLCTLVAPTPRVFGCAYGCALITGNPFTFDSYLLGGAYFTGAKVTAACGGAPMCPTFVAVEVTDVHVGWNEPSNVKILSCTDKGAKY